MSANSPALFEKAPCPWPCAEGPGEEGPWWVVKEVGVAWGEVGGLPGLPSHVARLCRARNTITPTLLALLLLMLKYSLKLLIFKYLVNLVQSGK